MLSKRLPKDLLKAKKLLNKGEYSAAINLLIPSARIYKGNFDYNYLIGVAHFYIQDFNSALVYLKISNQMDDLDLNVKLFLAFIMLRKNRFQDAIFYYVKALDIKKKCKEAKLGLKIVKDINLRKYDFEYIQSTKLVQKILPRRGFYISGKFILFFLSIVFFALFSFFVLPSLSKLWKDAFYYFIAKREMESSLEFKVDEKKLDLTLKEDVVKFYLTQEELKDEISKLKHNFVLKKDNKVRMNINKIVYSNANYDTKQKAKSYLGYLTKYDFTNFKTKDFIHYKEVEKDPLLFDKVYVRWKGRISNLVNSKNYIKFDLLVGYENSKIAYGIVPVIFYDPVSLHNGIAVELIGTVYVKDKKKKDFALIGSSIREIKVES